MVIGAAQRDRLILEHRDFAEALARELHQKLPRHVEFDETRAMAMVGLVEAASRFDPASGAAFKTFAYYRIRGAILDGVRQWARQNPQGHSTHELTQVLGVEESMNEIGEGAACAAACSGDVEQAMRNYAANTAVVVLLSGAAVDAAASDDDPAADAEAAEWYARVRASVALLDEQEATIVRMHYFDGASFTECAVTLGKHKAWISRLHARAIERIRSTLKRDTDMRPPRTAA